MKQTSCADHLHRVSLAFPLREKKSRLPLAKNALRRFLRLPSLRTVTFDKTKKRKEIQLKKKSVLATAAALGIALLFYAHGASAANPASDDWASYHNPWGPVNPQNNANTGFAPWVFDEYNPPYSQSGRN
jgi:hypothetical protein